MNHAINMTQALRVYALVIDKGTKAQDSQQANTQQLNTESDDSYCYEEMLAWSDYDGYTAYLKYNQVTLTLLFHGKYLLDYPSDAKLAAFIQKLNKLANEVK
ncbi:DUF3081 family protein [Shewanella algidipiscicola]|uniref:DUF3081 domain-containing protein n=1 Tax=Shewanella algidipiscicola TaxID=614070 RepID=A0ABQ4P614_9GAMM|nr:DUF3081 family protein [Shewanella algidipiscicola]GIU42868.1 hypothetical protein TUM4630_04840 [Shewanella algidipiscicola]